ncbi:hypothetical protein MOMA_08496 [Moraxella macacae 0408225]|uniref:Uncharacterized protein n=1 Tax=Moraxella macacae 0408225 TaxID=1230338 RepID=L2F6E3_9GAMM|nr:hypothetical protein [Moraxella macacae]ELA08587.1 hypothetical protein MOMA_08496 [Moraxella macacae 0408225]
MLDIAKIQADIELTRQSVNESQKRSRNFDADLERIRQDVAESRATVEQMSIANDKFRAEQQKIEKEARFYPYITLISAMIGGLVVAVITKLF